MEKYTLSNDVTVICKQASSFPSGIISAFQSLEKLISQDIERDYYGISYMQGGEIIYKAAVEEAYDGEAKNLSIEAFTIKQGDYLGEEVRDFRTNPQRIGRVFTDLLSHPGIDPIAPCIEAYSKDGNVLCMIKMK